MSTQIYPLLLVIPLAAAAYFLQIYPRRRLVLLALVPLLASLAIPLGATAMFWPLVVLDAVLAVAAIADLATLPRAKSISVERQLGRTASLGKPHRVVITIANASRRAASLSLRDDIPAAMTADPDQSDLRLAPRSRITLHYDLVPQKRGAFTLSFVYLRLYSRLGLWHRLLKLPMQATLAVYPDLQQLGEYELLARTNRLSLLGVRRTRRIGLDNEFERLRDYTLDDNYKYIDWRSTARRGKLTVKDFQSNQAQRLVFLVDCGRMMTGESAGMSLLDHAFNAILMLSFVALKQGDSVGMLTFSDEIHGYVPPQGGRNQMNRLVHAAFDRFPRLVESRYDQAFLHLASQCRKRALVVLITNVIDEVNSHQIEQYLSHLVGRHLPLGVLLRDHRLFDAAETPDRTSKQMFRAAAAADILLWRRQVLADLQSKGVLSLDVFPEQMTAPLVNQYLDIKARHLL
jgi:uncharacterized protein (DUF58 family)